MYTSFTNNLHRHFLRFLLGNLDVLGEIPNNDYEKFGGGGGMVGVVKEVYYGNCASRELSRPKTNVLPWYLTLS